MGVKTLNVPLKISQIKSNLRNCTGQMENESNWIASTRGEEIGICDIIRVIRYLKEYLKMGLPFPLLSLSKTVFQAMNSQDPSNESVMNVLTARITNFGSTNQRRH